MNTMLSDPKGGPRRRGRKTPLSCLRAAAGRKGVVLIAVLWFCAILMWAGLQISTRTRLIGEDQLHSIIETHALYLAVGGCYEALARMVQAGPLQSNMPPDQNWQPDGQPRVVKYDTGVAVVIMESDDQKINVNTANADQLVKVLEKAGADEGTSQIIAGRIADFVRSQNTSIQGLSTPGVHPNNDAGFGGPLTSLDQLLLVPGVTQQLYYGYQQASKGDSGVPGQVVLPGANSLFSQLTIQTGNGTLQPGIQNPQGDANMQGSSLTQNPLTQNPLTQNSLTQNSWTTGGTYRILSFGKSAMGLPGVGVRITVRLQGGGQLPYQILSRKVL